MNFKRFVISLVAVSFFGSFLFTYNTSLVGASTTKFNKAPAILCGDWRTRIHKTKRGANFRNRYWFTNLYVNNTQFHLEDFMLNKYKHNEYNSGPYGSFKGYWSLGFQKYTSHRYYIWGSMQPDVMYKKYTGYGVVLSKNYKSLKLYYFKVKAHKTTVSFGKAHYVNHFYKRADPYK